MVPVVANPKSPILTLLFSVKKTFAGFKSLWIIFFSWIYTRPSKIPLIIWILLASSWNLLLMNYFKLIPWQNYITIYKILNGNYDFSL